MQIDLLKQTAFNLEKVASLQAGDNLSTGRHFKVWHVQAIDPSASKARQCLQRVINIIQRLWQTLCRFVTLQTTAKNLRDLKNLMVKCETLSAEGQIGDYKWLRHVGRIHSQLKRFVNGSIDAYTDTVLFRSSPKRRETYKRELEEISRQATTAEVLLREACEKEVDKNFTQDRDLVKGALQSLYTHKNASIAMPMVSMKAVRSELNCTFGHSIVEEVLTFYGFENELILTSKQLHALLVGITANLRLEDLCHFAKNRSDLLTQLDPKLAANLPQNGKDWSEAQLCEVLHQARDIGVPVVDSYKHKPYAKQLQRDIAFQQACKLADNYNYEKAAEKTPLHDFAPYAFAEFLARDIAYACFAVTPTRFSEGALLPSYNAEGKRHCQAAHLLFSGEGLNGVCLRAARPEAKNSYLQTFFRGTYDWLSVKRNLGFFSKGIGRSVFDRHEKVLCKNWKRLFDLVHSKTGVMPQCEFGGHSLGALDGQRMVLAASSYLAQEKNSSIAPVFNLFAFNAPGIESDKIKAFLKVVQKHPRWKFNLRYFKTHHDMVQRFAKGLLGYANTDKWRAKLDAMRNLNISIAKFDRPLAIYAIRLKEDLLKGRLISAIVNLFKAMYWAHTKRCLTIHDGERPKEWNSTYVRTFKTSFEEDEGKSFGRHMTKKVQVITSRSEMNKRLATEIGQALEELHLWLTKPFKNCCGMQVAAAA